MAPRTDFIEAYSFPGGHGAAAPAKLRIAESPARMSGAMFDTWRPPPPLPGESGANHHAHTVAQAASCGGTERKPQRWGGGEAARRTTPETF